MGRVEVLEASLHLGTGPGAGTMVVLKVPPDRQQLRSGHVLESGRFFAYSLLIANHLNQELWLAQ
jgi:hypothetical protein